MDAIELNERRIFFLLIAPRNTTKIKRSKQLPLKNRKTCRFPPKMNSSQEHSRIIGQSIESLTKSPFLSKMIVSVSHGNTER